MTIDWKNVKRGMTFTCGSHESHLIFRYVGEDLHDGRCAVFECPDEFPHVYDGYPKINMTRAPNDMEMVK